MKNPKFTVFKDTAGEFRFNLFAVNGENILRSSEGYTSKQGCINGINSVKQNAPFDYRYSRLTASSGQYYFTLKASNGEVLGISEMYTSTYGRENGIESVKSNAPTAPIDDLT